MANFDLTVYQNASRGILPASLTHTRIGKRYILIGAIIGLCVAGLGSVTHGERLWLNHIGLGSAGFAGVALVGGIVLGALLSLVVRGAHAARSQIATSKLLAKKAERIFLGTATGEFKRLGHGRSIAKGHPVSLGMNDLTFNLVAFGGTGSGKTTAFINPVLGQLLAFDCGGLVLDIKGDYGDTVHVLVAKSNKEVVEVGVGAEPVNLIAGLTPEIAASFLRDVLIASGKTNESFFNNASYNVFRNALGILEGLGPEPYSLYHLYRFIFVNPKPYLEVAQEQLARMSDRIARERLAGSCEWYVNVWNKTDEKTAANIKATIALVLSPFSEPAFRTAFCMGTARSMDEVITQGNVWLMRLPLAVYGQGARIAYTLIKLRFFNLMQRRTTTPELNNGRYVFLACDEYQEVVSASNQGLSDLTFWDKSRSSKCIGLISTQSTSSFRAAIGNDTVADTVLQNFRQKVFFRSEDSATLRYVCDLLGKVERERTSYSDATPGGSTTTATHVEDMISPQYFRNLDGMVTLLQIGGASYDDVLKPIPLII